MRRWSGELDGPLCHGQDDRSRLYTRNGIGLPSPLLFILSLSISWINYASFREGFMVFT